MKFLAFVAGAAALAILPAAAQSKVERYTQAQTAPAFSTVTKIVRLDGGPDDAPTITRTHAYDSPAYTSGAPVPETSGVRVFRGGHQGPSRPCSWQSGSPGIVTYSGCGDIYGDAASELAGGRTASQALLAAHVPVIGLRRGICTRKIQRRETLSPRSTRYDVCYADLQPVHGRQVTRLYDRIETAARRACGTRAGYGAGRDREACEAVAIDTAVYRTGLQVLVDHHVGETGSRPRIIVGALGDY